MCVNRYIYMYMYIGRALGEFVEIEAKVLKLRRTLLRVREEFVGDERVRGELVGAERGQGNVLQKLDVDGLHRGPNVVR